MERRSAPPSGRPAPLCFAVLVPHRDSRRFLRRRSGELFASGLWGAWSFPHLAPLALLSAPLDGPALRDLARALRELTLAEGRDGMLRPGPEGSLALPGLDGGFSIYGPSLDLTISPLVVSPSVRRKLRALVSRPLLGCAILGPDDSPGFPPLSRAPIMGGEAAPPGPPPPPGGGGAGAGGAPTAPSVWSSATPLRGGSPPATPPGPRPPVPAEPSLVPAFRAAAAANLVYRFTGAGDGGYSCSWRIGELHWLPPCRRSRSAGHRPRPPEAARNGEPSD
jgi:hypothetical protein